MLKMKRVYEEYSETDGIRILVDRVWPRGITKERAHLDYWFKDITPSTKIRKEFGHKKENFKSFKKKYLSELDNDIEKIQKERELLELLQNNDVTLIYAAKDPQINHVVILKKYLEDLQKIN